MVTAKPSRLIKDAPCLRTYGRGDVALRGYLESPLARTPCWVRDLSLSGARIETEQNLAPDQSIWLSVRKLKIFGTVKWVRGNLAGIQFEEKLPKSIVLNLCGEVVDPEALAAMEAMLAAQNWVIGTPTDRPRNVRIADVLGARGKRSDQPLAGVAQAPEGFQPEKAPIERSSKRRAATVIALSAAIGLLLGLGSILIF
jgi:hypothetical protein